MLHIFEVLLAQILYHKNNLIITIGQLEKFKYLYIRKKIKS